jgi:hypothetical protein
LYDPDDDSFRSFVNNPKNPQSLSNNTIWHLYEDSKGHIWISTDKGLNRYIKETDMFLHYFNEPDNPHSLSSDKVFSLMEDSKGNYWVGTMGGGLNHFDQANEKFFAFTEEDGLPNNVVYITLEDKMGNLWLSTNWGLSVFDPSDTTFINYDIKDGLQGNEFNGNAYFLDDDGEMYFGGMNGFNAFYPNDIKRNTLIPRIVITAFKKFNQVMNMPIKDGDTLYLDYFDNFFGFEFSALDYTNPSKNKYRFRMEGYDQNWIYRDAEHRFAEYANVTPGTYTFCVTGSNNDGVWNDRGLCLTIIITPPWWGTWTFRITFGLFLLVSIWFIVYRRIQNIKARHEVERKVLEIERQLFEVEQKSLQLQMNPHFLFNSLNAIQSFVIANDTDKAIHYLAKFSQLMRLILTNSRESHVAVKDEIKALTYFMDIEKLRFDNKFDYKISIDPRIDDEFMAIPPMIIQPFVENSILHGVIHSPKHGKIEVDLKLKKDTIFCTIQDNGIGREEAIKIREASGIKRQSKGMIITRERIDLLNRQNKGKYSINIIDLKDESDKAQGTRVEIMMFYQEL